VNWTGLTNEERNLPLELDSTEVVRELRFDCNCGGIANERFTPLQSARIRVDPDRTHQFADPAPGREDQPEPQHRTFVQVRRRELGAQIGQLDDGEDAVAFDVLAADLLFLEQFDGGDRRAVPNRP
jgi:hypothetical protein